MAEILLTHSYFLRFDPKEYQAMMPYPPLGTLYAAGLLRQRGYSVAVFDSMLAKDESEIQIALQQHMPKMVVIYDDDFNYLTKMCLSRMRNAAFRLARFAKQAKAVVAAHGSDASDHPSEYIEHGVDFILCGEAEATLSELTDHVFGRSDRMLHEIQGLAYSESASVDSASKLIRTTAKREVQRNLDVLPWPARDLVDIERYRRIWKQRHGYFSINMVTTRGCPFHCNWCAKPIYGQLYHARSPADVVEELKHVREQIRPDHIWFCDDIFGLKPYWIHEFSDRVTAEKASVPFKCLSRVDLLLKEHSFRDLKRAGCQTVWVGAESGSQEILDAMEKGTTVEQVYEATRKLHEHNIRVGFFLQFGYPGETMEDIGATLRMVRDCNPDEIGVSVSYPLPGTKFYNRVRDELGNKRNWVDSQDLALLFAGNYTPDFYRTLHRVVHRLYRLHQARRFAFELAQRPSSLSRNRVRTMALTPYYFSSLAYYWVKLKRLEKVPNRGPRYAEP